MHMLFLRNLDMFMHEEFVSEDLLFDRESVMRDPHVVWYIQCVGVLLLPIVWVYILVVSCPSWGLEGTHMYMYSTGKKTQQKYC